MSRFTDSLWATGAVDTAWPARRVDPACAHARPLTDEERDRLFASYIADPAPELRRPAAPARMATYVADERRARRRTLLARVTVAFALFAVLAAITIVPLQAQLGWVQ